MPAPPTAIQKSSATTARTWAGRREGLHHALERVPRRAPRRLAAVGVREIAVQQEHVDVLECACACVHACDLCAWTRCGAAAVRAGAAAGPPLPHHTAPCRARGAKEWKGHLRSRRCPRTSRRRTGTSGRRPARRMTPRRSSPSRRRQRGSSTLSAAPDPSASCDG